MSKLRIEPADDARDLKGERPLFPTADEIAGRAHELFSSDGRLIRRIPDYWRKAETELLNQAARRAIGGIRK